MAMASASATISILVLVLLPFLPSSSPSPVSSTPLPLLYHHGPILSLDHPILLHLTFYGTFPPSLRSTLLSFLSSLSPPSPLPSRRSLLRLSPLFPVAPPPTVSQWWSLTQHYRDSRGCHVSQKVVVASEIEDDYSRGRFLRRSDVADLARRSVGKGKGVNSVGLVFTAEDVYVDGFCMHSCGGHSFLEEEAVNGSSVQERLPYAWVGNAEKQCPGLCSWPFASQEHGPPAAASIAPNGIGADGMVMGLAKVLAGLATNPFMDGFFYQEDETSSPANSPAFGLEIGEACSGKFGPGAYPGFPGRLLQNPSSGASYNMEGDGGALFLVPWIWNPAIQACAGQA